MILLTLLMTLGFVLIHVLIGRLKLLDGLPRSRWLSFAGGVAVAYVFLHILPELSGHQRSVAEATEGDAQATQPWIYLIALLGLAVFYGLERAAGVARKRSDGPGRDDAVEAGIFWIHMAFFAFYNVLIGYLLLHREETGLLSLLTYFVALGLHFVTTDHGLREYLKDRYDKVGRWILAAAVLLGWGLGVFVELPGWTIAVLFAFLAGSIVLNVLKEELPEDRESRYGAFALGAGGYAALLLLV